MVRHNFPKAPRHPQWEHVEDEKWNNWMWQHQNRVKSLDQLEKLFPLTESERKAVVGTSKDFMMAVTPYYVSLIDGNDPNCPIRKQSIPTEEEMQILPEDLEDPLGEEADMPVPGVTHRYPDRVLFYTTHTCPVFCRHCTRKRKVADPTSSASMLQIDSGLNYIRSHKEVRDVVISGGDPLSLNDAKIEHILKSLREMPNIEMFRIGTRNPVTLPQRITDDFVAMVKKYHPVYINTHFNHPKECTQEAFDVCTKLADAGCVLGNQMVLLKGVNDDPAVVKELNHKLLMMRVRPYYIYFADLAQGIGHFRTTFESGLEIIEKLRGWTSGLAIPQLVIDAPGGGGKIPVLPTYIQDIDDNKITLRNYKKDKSYVYFMGK